MNVQLILALNDLSECKDCQACYIIRRVPNDDVASDLRARYPFYS